MHAWGKWSQLMKLLGQVWASFGGCEGYECGLRVFGQHSAVAIDRVENIRNCW